MAADSAIWRIGMLYAAGLDGRKRLPEARELRLRIALVPRSPPSRNVREHALELDMRQVMQR
jgi:hypothetical protein